jgi:hypothetical protein
MTRVCALALLLVVDSGMSPALSRELSDRQRQSLERGEVVVLDVLPPGGQPRAAQGGTALGVVNAPAEEVWRVLVDYPRHSGLYPRVTASEVLEADPGHALVRYVVGLGPFSFGFHVDNYPDAGRRRLDWHLAAGRTNQLFRRSWGYWQIDGRQEGVLLTYAMAAETVLPAFLTRGAERDGLVDTVKAVRERAERRS